MVKFMVDEEMSEVTNIRGYVDYAEQQPPLTALGYT